MLIYNSGQILRDFHVTRIWPLYLGFDATKVLELYLSLNSNIKTNDKIY
jgi:hypothetical protein